MRNDLGDWRKLSKVMNKLIERKHVGDIQTEAAHRLQVNKRIAVLLSLRAF